jgi:hypothetical protein
MPANHGIVEGHNGDITWSQGAGVTNTHPPAMSRVFQFRAELRQIMVETTPFNQASKQFLPSHGVIVIDFKAYIDQGFSPGTFDEVEATISVWPDRLNSASKKLVIGGYLESWRWEVAVGLPNVIVGRIRGTDDGTYSWT